MRVRGRVAAAGSIAAADVRAAWARGGRRERAWLAAGLMLAAVLAGACLFGIWHVLFGGVVKWNWRAGAFGIVLAAVAGVALAVEVAAWRRLGRGRQ
jgi:membrane protein YdbS with pleckstrin-like domain